MTSLLVCTHLFLGSSLQSAQLVCVCVFRPFPTCALQKVLLALQKGILALQKVLSFPCTRVTMASPSPSPDYKRYSPSPKREALPERSRSNSQTRWGKQKENGTGEWESWPSSHWGWQTWYENEEEDWQSWSQKDTDWQWKGQRKWETWQGQGQGHWDTYQDDWRDTYQDDWSDTYQDDWSDKSSSDRASSAWHRGDGWESDDGPTEVVLKEREWKKRPGSQKEKEMLKLVQRVQGKAQTKEELQVQRLAAMGGSRFRRLQKRSHLPRKDKAPCWAQPTQPAQPAKPAHLKWVESAGWGDGIWLEQQRMNQEHGSTSKGSWLTGGLRPPHGIHQLWVLAGSSTQASCHSKNQFILHVYFIAGCLCCFGRWAAAASTPRQWPRTVFLLDLLCAQTQLLNVCTCHHRTPWGSNSHQQSCRWVTETLLMFIFPVRKPPSVQFTFPARRQCQEGAGEHKQQEQLQQLWQQLRGGGQS